MQKNAMPIRHRSYTASLVFAFSVFSSAWVCGDSISRKNVQDTAEGMLRTVLYKIFELAGESLDHIPPVMYEFEIGHARQADDRENMYSRVSTMPPIFNLANT